MLLFVPGKMKINECEKFVCNLNDKKLLRRLCQKYKTSFILN